MTYLIFQISNILQWAGSFVIVLLVLKNYHKYTRPIIILGALGVLSVFFQFLQTIVSTFFLAYHYLNPIGDAYSFAEGLIFLIFYYQFFKANKYFKIGLVVYILLSSIFYCLTIVGYPDYPWHALLRALRDLELIVLSIALFFKVLYRNPESFPTPLFLINAAILFYFSCTFILSLSMDYIATMLRDDFVLFWTFRNFLRFIFCVVVCINIWNARLLPVESATNSAPSNR